MIYNIFLPNLYLYLLVLLLAYLSTYSIGRLVNGFFPQLSATSNSLESIFTRLMIGFIVLVSSFAIFWTQGDSVFLLSVFILLFYVVYRKKDPINHIAFKRITLNELYLVAIVSVLFIIIFLIGYFLFFVNSAGNIYDDFVFYSNVSNILSLSHVESTSWFVGNKIPGMYHYAELWFNSFWSTIFRLNHLYTLILVTHIYLLSLILLGAFLIVRIYFQKHYIIVVLLAAVLLFFNPVVSLFVSYQYQVISRPKFFVIVLFALFATLQYLRGKKFETFMILMLLLPFNNVMAPGILSSLFFTIIVYLFLNNGFSYKTIINKYTILCVFTLLFFILFYGLRSKVENSYETDELLAIFNKQLIISNLEYIARAIMYAIIRLLPIAIILYFTTRKLNRKDAEMYWYLILFAFIGAIISAIIAGILSNYNNDAGQLSIVFNSIIVSFVVYLCLLYLLSMLKPWKTTIIAITLLVINVSNFNSQIFIKGTYNNDEIHFYHKLKTEFDKHKSLNFGYVRNYKNEENKNVQATRLKQIIPCRKISHIISTGYYAPYCLSVFNIPDSVKYNYDERRYSALWKYVQQVKRSGNYKSLDISIADFIKDTKINFVIVEKQTDIPPYLLSLKLLAEYDGNKIFEIKQR